MSVVTEEEEEATSPELTGSFDDLQGTYRYIETRKYRPDLPTINNFTKLVLKGRVKQWARYYRMFILNNRLLCNSDNSRKEDLPNRAVSLDFWVQAIRTTWECNTIRFLPYLIVLFLSIF